MNMADVQVHEEKEDHFVVSHGGGSPFRVAKQGVSKATLAKIRAHQIAQMFAQGGKVKGYADGGDVDGPAPTPAQALPVDPGDIRDPETGALRSEILAANHSNPEFSFNDSSRLVAAGLNPVPDIKPTDRVAPPGAEQSDVESALGVPHLAQPSEEGAGAGPQPGAAPKPPNASAAPPIWKFPDTPPAVRLGGAGFGGLEKDLVAAAGAKSKAEDEQAKVIGQKGAEFQALQSSKMRGLQAEAQTRQAQWAENDKRIAATAQAIADAKVDPDHYMHSRTTVQKIASFIALVLGGWGSGLSGQPNGALELHKAAIDRDIEAQKANLGKLQTQLGLYMQMGHSINEAAEMAKAELNDYTAAGLQAAAGKFAGPEAQALANQHRAETTAATAQVRADIRLKSMAADKERMELEVQKQQLAFAPYQRAAAMAAETGKVLPNEARVFMDPKRTVSLGKGVTYANTEKDRDEAVEAQQALRGGLSALQQYEAMADKVGFGGATTDEGKLLATNLQNAYQAILGRSNAPRGEQEKQLEVALPNPTSLFKSREGIQQIAKTYRQVLTRHAGAVLGSRLVGGLDAARAAAQ